MPIAARCRYLDPRVEDGVGIASAEVVRGFCKGFHDRCPLAQVAHAKDGTGFCD